MTPDAEAALNIARILKVNHAGECGAIRIYQAQIFVAKRLHPSLLPFLNETVAHEIDHCRSFLAAIRLRQTRPCMATELWALGGGLLGFVTALMGENAIMVCTKAVELTVHRHLVAQLAFLDGKDEALKTMIERIHVEELQHLHFAETHVRPSFLNAPLESLISISTEIIIWLSTQGAVSRMEKALKVKHVRKV